MKKLLATALLIVGAISSQAFAASQAQYVRGMNLTETEGFPYDAAVAGGAKLSAQIAVDGMKRIGVKHVVLNPRAVMTSPFDNEVIPRTPLSERADERQRYQRLIQYIHSQGMTVGIRPIFFVVDSQGRTPFVDTAGKIWWHGNIQPQDPNRWFESFKSYLDIYLLIAKVNKVEEFTIGAELYSMTVGIEDQWKQYPYGFPAQWLALLNYARTKVIPGCRLMYDINFTDDAVNSAGGLRTTGGELERWRYRLVDLANRPNPTEKKIWEELVAFWSSLDAVGIDMYRSLASSNDQLPADYNALVAHLQKRADEYASQLDSMITEIEATINVQKPIIFKEIGYKSVTRGFINPFAYDNRSDEVNIAHQAAAYQAYFNSFWKPNWSWFSGVSFWDVGVNPARTGVKDPGFSPLGKAQTESVIKAHFN